MPFRSSNNPRIRVLRRFNMQAVSGELSEYTVICRGCGREIMSVDEMRSTPQGKVVCDDCARDSYVDVPLA